MNYWRKLVALAALAALLASLVALVPGTGVAANLTLGTYTYLVNGEELSVQYDPLVRKDGLLLPSEVFQVLRITVEGGTSKNPTLRLGEETIRLTVGSPLIERNGAFENTAPAPVRLNGRLFLPADVLKHFGMEYTQDGTSVMLRPYVDGAPVAKQVTDADYAAQKSVRTLSASLKLDTNIYVPGEFTLLNADLLGAANLKMPYGTRMRLQAMLQTNTLVLVKLSNTAFKAGALVTTGLWLVDAQRNQYDVVSVQDIGQGLLTAKLAPGADRLGILVYPKLPAGVATVDLYYDNNTAVLGNWIKP